MSKKEKLVKTLEKRRIISYEEIVNTLGSINTAKHYIMELKKFGVLKYRDSIKAQGKRIVVYFVSKKGLEEYKRELQRRKEKKAEILKKIKR
ncbi:hypothetical protein [Sulfurisphaera ohwakuensis]|uniref:Putative ArsR family transcriptional regulator n=1 Tax=Sulfurisphaera ohwakuensis TaxID=69656 RepID=A0A650CIY2_SULOH|nr:hypothetical protein [Sulfurisphaera ohwakuensis]MBB5253514.1 putative ArsR family transcriptional regulator [Sulfurisphaera ohwakuensis]QGR17821.1 hypothetical protein D1869_12010 [Sulfurisphaera ohwakuensis]